MKIGGAKRPERLGRCDSENRTVHPWRTIARGELIASVQVCGYHNTKGKNVLSWLQLCGVVTKRHFTFGKRFAGSPALVYVPTDFDTIEKALSRANAAEKGLK